MIDASAGFMKDGPKNRLRDQDIHRIVDVFTRQAELPKYSRMVGFAEIEKNEFNLNLPRYIDSQTAEDVQDIAGHLQGGIPVVDVEALDRYWGVCPGLRQALFRANRPATSTWPWTRRPSRPPSSSTRSSPRSRPAWPALCRLAHGQRGRAQGAADGLQTEGGHRRPCGGPAGALRRQAAHRPVRRLPAPDGLLGRDLQDDCYLVAADGWQAQTYRVIERDKRGNERDQGWACDLVPKPCSSPATSPRSRPPSTSLPRNWKASPRALAELEEEEGGEEGVFAEWKR